MALSTDNVTTESPAAHGCAPLLAALGPTLVADPGVRRAELRIDEIAGQGASFIGEFT